jgi:hypothetical protein
MGKIYADSERVIMWLGQGLRDERGRLPALTSRTCLSFIHENQYWSWAWVVQEVMLASRPVLLPLHGMPWAYRSTALRAIFHELQPAHSTGSVIICEGTKNSKPLTPVYIGRSEMRLLPGSDLERTRIRSLTGTEENKIAADNKIAVHENQHEGASPVRTTSSLSVNLSYDQQHPGEPGE